MCQNGASQTAARHGCECCEITAKSVGTAVISATSHNNICAISTITGVQERVTPTTGDEYKISFNHFESDGQTELTSATILEQVTLGDDYISSFTGLSKVYKGMKGLKFGSSRSGGSMTINFNDQIKSLDCKQIILNVTRYGSTSTTINVSANNVQIGTGSSADSELVISLDNPININNLPSKFNYISVSCS